MNAPAPALPAPRPLPNAELARPEQADALVQWFLELTRASFLKDGEYRADLHVLGDFDPRGKPLDLPSLHVAPFLGDLRNSAQKNMYAAVMRRYCDHVHAFAAFFASEAWVSMKRLEDRAPGELPEHDPNRREVLLVIVEHATLPARTFHGPITEVRDGARVVRRELGPWEELAQMTQQGGRFSGWLRERRSHVS